MRHLLIACLLSLLGCEPTSIALAAEGDDARLAALEDALAETQEQLAELQQHQADQDQALAECLTLAENASVNAAAAQERSAALEDELDDSQLWVRLAELEAAVETLWIAVEALYG